MKAQRQAKNMSPAEHRPHTCFNMHCKLRLQPLESLFKSSSDIVILDSRLESSENYTKLNELSQRELSTVTCN